MELKNLAHNLRMLRRSRNISTFELSEEIKLVTNKISHLENGRKIRIMDDELERIAKYFNITVTDLLEKKATIVFK